MENKENVFFPGYLLTGKLKQNIPEPWLKTSAPLINLFFICSTLGYGNIAKKVTWWQRYQGR